MSTAAEQTSATDTLVERFGLKALVESCLVLEEGIASAKDIEIGMMMGAGILPGPFARADAQGLDDVLEALERAQSEWGEGFEPPLILRRLVAQGRLGQKSGQGFFPYPQVEGDDIVKLEDRGDIGIVWLNRPPANPLSPELVQKLIETWEQAEGKFRALVFASSNIFTFCAGADIKAFTKMDPGKEGRELVESAHRFMRGMEESKTVTIAAVNSIAFGGGCELAMACDFRIAAESATFGQPEINLGIIPGFGGTQRLPRLVGEAKALEMNLVGDPVDAYDAYRYGLVNQVVPDHELFDTALSWARKLSQQAPLAIEQIKKVSAQPELDKGLEVEGAGLRDRVRVRGRQGGDRRLPRQASAKVPGEVTPSATSTDAARLADLLSQAERAVVLTGAGISVPSGIPDFRTPGKGLWEKVDPMKVAHVDAFRRSPDEFWTFYGQRFAMLSEIRPNPAHEAVAELERRGVIRGVITQNIDRLHRAAGSQNVIEVHGSIEWCICEMCGGKVGYDEVNKILASGHADARVRHLHHAAEAERRPVRRDAARGRDGRRHGARGGGGPDALHRLVARGVPGRRAARPDARQGRPDRAGDAGPDAVRRRG